MDRSQKGTSHDGGNRGGSHGRQQNNRTPRSRASTPSRNHRNPHQQSSPHTQSNNKPSAMPMSGVPYGCLPAFLPGSASLVEQLDQRVMIVLRDGRHLVGTLRSFDQFSNMVLEDTSERRVLHIKNKRRQGGDEMCCYYTDVCLGLYMVRGDSMVLLGEVEEDDDSTKKTEKVTPPPPAGMPHLMYTNTRVADTKRYMKEVSLEEFKKLQKEAEEKEKIGDECVEHLTWEFDADLVV